jgi:CspA family cold shock protein
MWGHGEARTSGDDGRRRRQVAFGTVKWFNSEKGYGFVTPDGGGKDLFVHFSNIVGEGYRSLQDNQKVEYEEREGKKGPEAANVRPL